MLRVWHGLETILDAFMEISPRKVQPIPTNHHFCHRYVRPFTAASFVIPSLFQGNPTNNAGLALGELFQYLVLTKCGRFLIQG